MEIHLETLCPQIESPYLLQMQQPFSPSRAPTPTPFRLNTASQSIRIASSKTLFHEKFTSFPVYTCMYILPRLTSSIFLKRTFEFISYFFPHKKEIKVGSNIFSFYYNRIYIIIAIANA